MTDPSPQLDESRGASPAISRHSEDPPASPQLEQSPGESPAISKRSSAASVRSEQARGASASPAISKHSEDPPASVPSEQARSSSPAISRHSEVEAVADAGEPVADELVGFAAASPAASPADDSYDCNTCVEKAGWGNYQWRVVFMMGGIYFVMATGSFLPSIIDKVLVCEWGLSPVEYACLPFVYYVGSGVGAMTTGNFAERFGRIPVMKAAFVLMTLFVIGCAVSPTYWCYMIFTTASGFTNGGSQGVLVAYTAEMVPKNSRSRHSLILKCCATGGRVFDCLLAFFIMDGHNGWRIYVLCNACLCIGAIGILMFTDESPRYLAINNRKDEAVEVLAKICKVNGTEMPKGEMTVTKEAKATYAEILQAPYTKLSILIGIIYFCNMYIVFGFFYFIPDLMSYGFCGLATFFTTTYEDERGCIVYTKSEYIFIAFVRIINIPGYILGGHVADKFGRLPSVRVVVWVALGVVACFLVCISNVVTVIVLIAAIILLRANFHILFIYIPEVYPTYIRATASGIMLGMGRFGAATGSLVIVYLDEISIVYTLYTILFVLLINAIATLFLQKSKETNNAVLVDNRGGSVQGTGSSGYGAINEGTPSGSRGKDIEGAEKED